MNDDLTRPPTTPRSCACDDGRARRRVRAARNARPTGSLTRSSRSTRRSTSVTVAVRKLRPPGRRRRRHGRRALHGVAPLVARRGPTSHWARTSGIAGRTSARLIPIVAASDEYRLSTCTRPNRSAASSRTTSGTWSSNSRRWRVPTNCSSGAQRRARGRTNPRGALGSANPGR